MASLLYNLAAQLPQGWKDVAVRLLSLEWASPRCETARVNAALASVLGRSVGREIISFQSGGSTKRRFDESRYNPSHFEKVQWFAKYWNETALRWV
jgi:hypothetical protein